MHRAWYKPCAFVMSLVLLAAVHSALAVQTAVWATAASMDHEGALPSGLLTGIAVLLTWPIDLFPSPAQRMAYGWVLGWANSLTWGLGLTIVGWAVLRFIKARREREHGGSPIGTGP